MRREIIGVSQAVRAGARVVNIDFGMDDEDRCELREGEDRCPNRATRIVKEPYTPAGFQQFVCDECAKSQIDFGYIDGGLICDSLKGGCK